MIKANVTPVSRQDKRFAAYRRKTACPDYPWTRQSFLALKEPIRDWPTFGFAPR